MRRGRTRRGVNIKKPSTLLVIISIVVIILSITILVLKGIQRHKEELILEQQRQETLAKIYEETEEVKKGTSENTSEENSDEKKVQVKPSKAKIKIVGNILIENGILRSSYNRESNEYNFSPIFENVKSLITDSDITIGNLETNFANDNYTSHNSPRSIINTMKELKISAVNIANNQNLSDGLDGLISTKKALLDEGLKPYGTSMNDEDSKIAFVEVNGIKIAFLSYITRIDSGVRVSDGDENYINIYSDEKVDKDFEYVKGEGAEYIIVNIHTGSNSYRLSKEEQENINNKLVSSGADIVLGTHQYAIGKMEIKDKPDGKKAFIANSMGDLIADNSKLGMVLEVTISKDENGITLNRVFYTPIYTLKTNEGYKLLDIRETIKKYENEDNTIVSKDVYNILKEQLNVLENSIRD